MVVGFTSAPWVLLGSSGVIGFIVSRHGSFWVYLGSLCSRRCALGFVRLIRGRLVHSRACAIAVPGFICGSWVNSRAPSESLGSLPSARGVVGFTPTSAGGLWLIRGRWVHFGCRWVHPMSLGSLACPQGVVGFIQVRWFHSHAPWGSIGSFRVVVFDRARRGCR